MRIMQLIDSLNPGGAERMAVNYANALVGYGHKSFLITTREEGAFKSLLNPEVDYYYLEKETIFDWQALRKLDFYIKRNNIEIIHAHGTSWFFAVLYKLKNADIKLIWHDHYGNSDFLENRRILLLKLLSIRFNGIISVNNNLKCWAKKNLWCDNIIFLNNFIEITNKTLTNLKLEGAANWNLICIANLRPQKDHPNLIEAFELLSKHHSVALHLFGKEYGDEYSNKLIEIFDKTPFVFWYGEKENISPWLFKSDIGVLSSVSEGLPVALLEYADAGLAVVCTDVGECREVLGTEGILVPSKSPVELAQAISFYLKNDNKRENDSIGLKRRIQNFYAAESIMPFYLKFCKDLC
ncbi:glycosyltransferase [Christiangramia salexigens]|uniref:Glycosyltransferase subfamily 4-like N-terminal domain-containing protein n=1 Tax=Christiangramia salexigens TaxID=1913577 RepID=A0A1L3J4Q5_9FLAO|nr:glycosyltransferase [Christiangramia salexigens]APG60092.1 hypothetical protein LPB144_06535 [Christiangramia salexigens]